MSALFRKSAQFAAFALLLCAAARAGTVGTVVFQERSYEVNLIPLAANVPGAAGCDLIFVITPTNQKFLCIPSNAGERACFDPNLQVFYRLDRSFGVVNAFTALNGALINLDGTFFQSRTETPALNENTQSSLEFYSIPLGIDPDLNADIAILSDDTIAYRTAETKVHEISRDPNSFIRRSYDINDPVLNAPGRVAVDYDFENQTLLMVEAAVNAIDGTPIPDRISSYFRTPQKFDQIILDNNPSIPGYNGNASGIAFDVDNGDIYVLDGNQLIYFRPLRPTLSSVTPNKGPAAGGITVTIKGQNIPPDAIVFFDATQASNIVVVNSTTLTCTVPPHALGAVDVSMTGTGVVVGVPITLTNGFTYANSVPIAVLQASPTQGPAPLSVSFNIVGSADLDGTLITRIIDFGDGTSFTFPPDLSVTTTSHTYATNGTYTATLTVTDDGSATASDSEIIIAGTGGVDVIEVLVLRTLGLKIQPPPTLDVAGQITSAGTTVTGVGTQFLSSFAVSELIVADVPQPQGSPTPTHREYQVITGIQSDTVLTIAAPFTPDIVTPVSVKRAIAPGFRDSVKITGEVVLPLGITPGSLTGGKLAILLSGTEVTTAGLVLGANGLVKTPGEKFSMRLVKKRGYPAGTYSFTYMHTKTNIPNVNPDIESGRAQIPVIVNLFTPLGRSLSYQKTGANQAVVQIRSSKRGSTVSLVRR